MPQRCGQQPAGPALAILQGFRPRHARVGPQGGRFQVTGGIFQRHCDEKCILCPGERHIENPHFLAEGLGADGLRQCRIGQCPVPVGAAGAAQRQADAQLAVKKHRVAGIGGVELVGGARHKHHRKFQTLGPMYCHDGDAARPGLAGGILGQAAIVPGGPHGTHQCGKPGTAGAGCPGGKAAQVLPAAGTFRHGSHSRQIPGASKQFLYQGIHRQGAGQSAESRQLPDKFLKFGQIRRQDRTIQAAALDPAAQLDQIIRREGKHGAEQYRRHCHVLGRVINDFQQRRKGPHVRCIQQVRRRIGVNRNVCLLQCRLVDRKVHTAAQKNTEIPGVAGPGCIPLPHGKALRAELPDAGSNGAGIPCRVGAVDHIQLTKAGVCSLPSHHQALALAVGHTAQLFRKNGLEDGVDPRNDIGCAAEVGIQRDGGRSVRHRPGRPGLLLFNEYRGFRLAEAIDALLDVPHKEQVGGIRFGKRIINGVLQRIGVLVFIHQHRRIPGRDGITQRGAVAVGILKQLQGQVFVVGVVQQLFRHLGVKVTAGKVADRPGQCRHQRRSGDPVGEILLAGTEQKFGFQMVDLLFGPGPQLAGCKGGGICLLAAGDPSQPSPGQSLHRIHGGIPIPGSQALFQIVQIGIVVRKDRQIGSGSHIIPGSPVHRRSKKTAGTAHLAQRTGQQCFAPQGILRRLIALPHGGKVFQGFFRLRQ